MYLYWLMPLISTLIGWGTNFLAVKMLFHPRKKINLLFFSLQGIFPKRKNEFSQKLSTVITQEFFSLPDLIQKIESAEVKENILLIIKKKINDYLNNDLKVAFPMLAMFLSPAIIDNIEKKIVDELEKSLPEIISGITKYLQDNLQLEKILYEKINSFTSERLENIIFDIMKREFKMIEFLGAIIGFLIGLIQVLLLVLLT